MLRWMAGLVVFCLIGCGGGSDVSSGAVPATSSTPLEVRSAAGVVTSSASLERSVFTEWTIVGGQRPYSVQSADGAVLWASVSDDVLRLVGIRSATSPVEVVVKDAQQRVVRMALTVTAPVVVNPLVKLEASKVALAFGSLAKGQANVGVVIGTKPYTVVSSAPALVSATVTGDVVTLTALTATDSASTATVTVTDANANTATLAVLVEKSGQTTDVFMGLPVSTALRPASTKVIMVGGGTPPYALTSSDGSVVAVSTGGTQGATVQLKAGVIGTSVVTVTDAVGRRDSRLVSVTDSTAPLTLATTSTSGAVGDVLKLAIAGGRPPYVAIGDSSGVATSFVSDWLSEVWLTLAAPGIGVITVYDADRNTAKVTVGATGIALPTKLTISPAALTVSENLAKDDAGKLVRGVWTFSLFKVAGTATVTNSQPGLLDVQIEGNQVVVKSKLNADGSARNLCVGADTKAEIQVTDQALQTVTAVITIANDPACPA